jgi:hypothetical protein
MRLADEYADIAVIDGHSTEEVAARAALEAHLTRAKHG